MLLGRTAWAAEPGAQDEKCEMRGRADFVPELSKQWSKPSGTRATSMSSTPPISTSPCTNNSLNYEMMPKQSIEHHAGADTNDINDKKAGKTIATQTKATAEGGLDITGKI